MHFDFLSQKEIKEFLFQNNLKPKKSLGQNYLIDQNMIDKICVRIEELADAKVVVEIGPGLGSMTGGLLNHGFKVIAVEIDKNSVAFLQSRFSPCLAKDSSEWPKHELLVLQADFLAMKDFSYIDQLKSISSDSISIVGNLPYHITSSILFNCFEKWENVKNLVFMMQGEVAERISAHVDHKEYGILTVLVNYFCSEVKTLIKVSPHCFYPAPKVKSVVLHFTLREKSLGCKDYALFKEIVASAFNMRRKKLKSALGKASVATFNPAILKMIFEKYPEFADKRAENLSVLDFIELANTYFLLKKKDEK